MRTITFALLSSLLLFSCTKESNNNNASSTYIKAKMDGTDVTFNSMAMSTKMIANGTTMLSISGNVSAGAFEGITIGLNKTGSITTGTYREDDASNTYTLGAVYGKNQNDVWGAGINATPAHPFTVTITEITETRVKGTFTGGVYNDHGMGSAEKVFTNGEFNVPIQK
jgi:hypothetical protein